MERLDGAGAPATIRVAPSQALRLRPAQLQLPAEQQLEITRGTVRTFSVDSISTLHRFAADSSQHCGKRLENYLEISIISLKSVAN